MHLHSKEKAMHLKLYILYVCSIYKLCMHCIYLSDPSDVINVNICTLPVFGHNGSCRVPIYSISRCIYVIYLYTQDIYIYICGQGLGFPLNVYLYILNLSFTWFIF